MAHLDKVGEVRPQAPNNIERGRTMVTDETPEETEARHRREEIEADKTPGAGTMPKFSGLRKTLGGGQD